VSNPGLLVILDWILIVVFGGALFWAVVCFIAYIVDVFRGHRG